MAAPRLPLDLYATEAHHCHHLAPVWLALPDDARGDFVAPADAQPWLATQGIEPATALTAADRPTLTASTRALRMAREAGRSRVALIEHGYGQSYGGVTGSAEASHSSYPGGKHRPASLFLSPNEHAAARDRAAYPDVPVVVVGSPRVSTLPPWVPPTDRARPVVAFGTHWEASVAPEAGSAFVYWRLALRALARRYDVLATAHPMAYERLAWWYDRQGIAHTPTWDEVLARADLYVCDNSSTLYEFASTGRPVVVLNAPYMRRHVEHGLRFWQAATVGVQAWPSTRRSHGETTDVLLAAVAHALTDPPGQQAAREAALDMVYAHRQDAHTRAAAALLAWTGRSTRRRASGRPRGACVAERAS